jgi:hypothetical protein
VEHICLPDCQYVHVAIVGSATMTPEQAVQAERLVTMIVTSHRYLAVANKDTDHPFRSIAIISGDSPKGGVDLYARERAEGLNLEFKGYPPRNNRWEPEGYKERNLLIAQRCQVLYRVAVQDSKTYGSGWTADQAAAFGKPVFRFYI